MADADALHFILQLLVGSQPVGDGEGVPGQVSHCVPVVAVLLLGACAPHELRLVDEGQPVMVEHHGLELGGSLLAKLSLEKAVQVAAHSLFSYLLDVPGHVHHQFNLVFDGFDVAYVENPNLLDALVVGGVHLVVEQGGREGAQPEIVMGAPPVRYVVVDTVASRTCTFSLGREMANITIIVVRPHQTDVIGHLQAGMIDIEHLLVGDKHLGHPRHVFVYIAGQQLALVGNDPFQHRFLFGDGLGSFHGTVVYPSHAYGVEDRLSGHLFHPLFPKAAHRLAVVHIVVFALASFLPFHGGARSHWLTMRASDIDAIAFGHFAVAFGEEEGTRTLVHGWPVGVGPEPQHQFKDALIGLGTYLPLGTRFIGLAGPRHESPVFVVDEDASVFHAGSLFAHKVGGQTEHLLGTWLGIRPPFPGRYAHQPREFQQSVGHSVGIVSRDVQPALFHLHAESLLASVQRFGILADDNVSLASCADGGTQHLLKVS